MLNADRQQRSFAFVPNLRVSKLISGGQTGVDRAALDVAIELGIAHGGFCPRGRRAEDGRIADVYQLEEIASERYAARTEMNVRTADGTLILYRDTLRGGTRLTYELAREHGKPCHKVKLDGRADAAAVRRWLARQGMRTLNVAGPRESQAPGIYEAAREWLAMLLRGVV